MTKYSASDLCTQTEADENESLEFGRHNCCVYDINKQPACPSAHDETLYSSTAGGDVLQSVSKGRVLLENSERKKSLICVNNILP